MLRARANRETFVSATMCRQQCVLVCQGLKIMCFTCVFIFMNIKVMFIKIFCTRGRFEKKNTQKGNSENGLFLPLYYVTSKIFTALFKLQCKVFTQYTITLGFNLIHSRPHPQGLVFLFPQVVDLVLEQLVVLSSQLLQAASCRTIHMHTLTRYAPRKSL